MRGEEDDLGLGQSSKELKNGALSLGIQACYGLIEDHHWRILIDEPRQGQALPLSAGEVEPTAKACTDEGVDPLRQALHHPAESRNLQSFVDAGVFGRRLLKPHRDVLANGQVQVRWFLEEHGSIRLSWRQARTTWEPNTN
jgi:hypothetical protein